MATARAVAPLERLDTAHHTQRNDSNDFHSPARDQRITPVARDNLGNEASRACFRSTCENLIRGR